MLLDFKGVKPTVPLGEIPSFMILGLTLRTSSNNEEKPQDNLCLLFRSRYFLITRGDEAASASSEVLSS